MRVYHVTGDTGADRILRDGFDDAAATLDYEGVWVSAPPFDRASMPAAKYARLLAVDIDPEVLADYEVRILAADGTPLPGDDRYREWVVPAAVLNRWPLIDLGRPEDD